jgi:hypothetical protein
MNPTVKHIYIIATFLMVTFMLWRFTEKAEQGTNFVQTKIDSVPYIKPIAPKITNNYPQTILIQEKVDTVFREKAETDTIITGVKINGNKITIQKISPDGVKTEQTHTIETGSKVEIDSKNFNEKKQTKAGKLLRKVGKVAVKGLAVIGGVVIVYTAIK